MKIDGLKKLIKEAVREAIQEELKDILLEAVKSPKTVVSENYNGPQPFLNQPVMAHGTGTTSTVNHDLKRNLRSMIGGEFDAVISANSSHVQPSYTPPPSVNTMGEGSSLPGGEVSLDQIMGIMNGK
jgi:hypothetical protein